MPQSPEGWAVLVAAAIFVGYLVLKSLVSLRPRDPEVAGARRRLGEAKRRARGAGTDRAARGAAYREAAEVALEGLGQPNRAAALALRALRVSGDDTEAIDLLSSALRRARRTRRLERLLWRRLREGAGPGYDRAYEILLELYEGPLKRPEQASALRQMRAHKGRA